MSQSDLVRELKENINDLQSEKADMAKTIDSKERRIKQVLIKLEHATKDVQSTGHKIGELGKQVAELEAKLRAIVAPEEADYRAKTDQLTHIERFGGADAVRQRGTFNYSPVPGDDAKMETFR